ncbi:9066_t:CDS:2, partial [Gigaspora rosea]
MFINRHEKDTIFGSIMVLIFIFDEWICQMAITCTKTVKEATECFYLKSKLYNNKFMIFYDSGFKIHWIQIPVTERPHQTYLSTATEQLLR